MKRRFQFLSLTSASNHSGIVPGLKATPGRRSMGLKTFTFRIPESWHARITGQHVRAWATTCLATPQLMTSVREALNSRVSLRLPADLIQELVRCTGLSASEALRRVIAAGLRSTASLPVPVKPTFPTRERDSEIVSEELVGEDSSGCVIIRQRDSRGFGYLRTIPIDRETYLRSKGA